MMSRFRRVIGGLKPALMMVVVQVSYAGLYILFKVVANDGYSMTVITAYRSLVAFAFILPIAFFFDTTSIPNITPTVLFHSFLSAIFGASLQQNLFAEAVALANPTIAAAMYNLVPGVTFILAICFRLEKWKIGTRAGKAKVAGTLMGIGGAMILVFVKGTEIHIWNTHFSLTSNKKPSHHHNHSDVPNAQIWGSALAFAYCLSYSIWLIIQARMSEKFPWHYTSAALMSMMATIQSFIFALCIERDWNQWKLGWNMKLLTILYTGVGPSGIAWLLISCCVNLKGPLYASIFSPLLLVLMAIAGSLLLDESLNLGSVIGSVFVVIGLYLVLWGKGKELKTSSAQDEPLGIITANQDNNNNSISTQNYGSEMKPSVTTTQSSLAY